MPQEEKKLSKIEVHYEHPSKGSDHCRDCVHFEVDRRNECEIVAGTIRSGDWCDKFEENK